jgi:hypothetical protein
LLGIARRRESYHIISTIPHACLCSRLPRGRSHAYFCDTNLRLTSQRTREAHQICPPLSAFFFSSASTLNKDVRRTRSDYGALCTIRPPHTSSCLACKCVCRLYGHVLGTEEPEFRDHFQSEQILALHTRLRFR